MYTLHETLPKQIEYRGKRYRVNLAFDVVLACIALQQSANMPDHHKLSVIVGKLVPHAAKLPPQQQGELLTAVFSELIFRQTRQTRSGSVKAFDFEQDADLIYASFMQAYGIDLFAQQGKLHWWQFYSLFSGLPQSTKMREVMSVRTRKLPAPGKHNQEEIRALNELKQYYALTGSSVGDEYADGLAQLWSALERRVS